MATIFDILKQAAPKYYGTPSPFDFLPSYAQDGENALAASAFRNRSEPFQSVPRERTDPWGDPLGHLSGMASDLGDVHATIAKDPVGSLAWMLGGIPPALGQMGQSLYDSAMAPGRAYQGTLADPEASARELALNLAGIGGGRAVAKGLMAGAEAGPELGMFGGRLAKTADHAALAKAEAADAAGVPREDIWKQHGWFKGVDGKWRFEIDDSGLRAFPGPGKGIASGPVQHPQLADAYNMDGLRTDISNGPQRGSFSPWTEREVKSGWLFPKRETEVVNPGDLIASGPSEDIRKSVVAHELQHGVQFKEKYARGGSPKAFGPDEIAAERARLMAIKDDGWSSVSNFTGDTPDSQIAHMLYRKLAGETEARAVQARKALTPAERQAHPPWENGPYGYDVPESEQIVRFGDNGPAMSLPSELKHPRRLMGPDLNRYTEAAANNRADHWRGLAEHYAESNPEKSQYYAKQAADFEALLPRFGEDLARGKPYTPSKVIDNGDYVIRRATDERHGASDNYQTYRVHAKPDAIGDGPPSKAYGPDLGFANMKRHPDNRWETDMVEVLPKARGKGVAKALYGGIEQGIGHPMQPSGILLPDGYAMWQKRNPDLVRAHVQIPASKGNDPYWASPKYLMRSVEATTKSIDDIDKGLVGDPARNAEYKKYLEDYRVIYDEALARVPPEFKTPEALQAMFSNPDTPELAPLLLAGSTPRKAASDLLPMDLESRMARAKAMGFDTENVEYRGLTKPYDANVAKVLDRQMFSNDPETASGYSMSNYLDDPGPAAAGGQVSAIDKMLSELFNKSVGENHVSPNVVPAYTRKGKNLAIDANGSYFNSITPEMVPDKTIASKMNSSKSIDYISQLAKELGYDSVSVNNVVDHVGDFRAPASNVTVIHDPRNIRSIFAAFDPAKADSADLLAMNPPGLPLSSILPPPQKRKRSQQ